MFAFLLPLASKIITDAVAKIPDNEELGEKLIDICIVILEKAVKLTKTEMDDKLLLTVVQAIRAREEARCIGDNCLLFFYKYLKESNFTRAQRHGTLGKQRQCGICRYSFP